MALQFTLHSEIPAMPEMIYNAWLDSEEHAKMTNSESAEASHEIGAKYKAHGEYIVGENKELVPNKKIVQSWRSTSFKDTDPDSIIEVELEESHIGTKLTLVHSMVPDQEFHVEHGWTDHYFTPMIAYFLKKKHENG